LGVVAPRLAFGKKHAATATCQHAENAKDNGADEIPTHSPRHGGQDAMVLLTFLQRLARSCGGARAPHAMVKKSPRARRCRSAPSPPFGERGPRCRLSRCAAPDFYCAPWRCSPSATRICHLGLRIP